MRAETALVERLIRASQSRVIGESAQQIVVARARLVSAGQDCIDDAQPRLRADALVRYAVAGNDGAESRRRMFECAHDGGSDGHDAPAFATCALYRLVRYWRYAIRLVERQ